MTAYTATAAPFMACEIGFRHIACPHRFVETQDLSALFGVRHRRRVGAAPHTDVIAKDVASHTGVRLASGIEPAGRTVDGIQAQQRLTGGDEEMRG
ncbi:hypothetical protein [Burkholderia arboris]|uniref:hypothetical protein n=1 Tax=Burkholderia arboris TaxID=488730 RepID=UPI00210A7B46|nr:hypothetical protein [Burkholderia arboris]UTV59636.1 hypothetical protein NLX30_26320 [Burkholderia arboris]